MLKESKESQSCTLRVWQLHHCPMWCCISQKQDANRCMEVEHIGAAILDPPALAIMRPQADSGRADLPTNDLVRQTGFVDSCQVRCVLDGSMPICRCQSDHNVAPIFINPSLGGVSISALESNHWRHPAPRGWSCSPVGCSAAYPGPLPGHWIRIQSFQANLGRTSLDGRGPELPNL